MKQKFVSCGHHLENGSGCPEPGSDVVSHEDPFHPEFLGQPHNCCGGHKTIVLTRKKIAPGSYRLFDQDGRIIAFVEKSEEVSVVFPWDWRIHHRVRFTPKKGEGTVPTHDCAESLKAAVDRVQYLVARAGIESPPEKSEVRAAGNLVHGDLESTIYFTGTKEGISGRLLSFEQDWSGTQIYFRVGPEPHPNNPLQGMRKTTLHPTDLVRIGR